MDFFQDFGWYVFGFALLLFLTSILYYKGFIEKKGKKYLLVPFFIIVVVQIILTILAASSCRGEGCMGVVYLLFGIPVVIAVLVGIVCINWAVFRIFKIIDKKRLKIFWIILGIGCILPVILLGFSPGDANGIERKAIATGSIQKCDSIIFDLSATNNRARRESCKLQVAKAINTFDVCKTFETPQMRQACVSWAVARTGEQNWCDILEGQEKLHCEQIVQTSNWMRENYCTYGSYTSCLVNICKETFLNNKYELSVESSINTCLQRLAIQKSQDQACMKMLSIPGLPGHGDATACSRFLAEMRNLSTVCSPGQNHLDCLNTVCPDHTYSLDKLNACFRIKAIDGLDTSWCQRIINGDPGSCENQIYARQRNLR